MLTQILADQSTNQGVAVGVIYLIAIVAVLWIIFGKHDDGRRD